MYTLVFVIVVAIIFGIAGFLCGRNFYKNDGPEKKFLEAHPLCAACGRNGKYKKATVVWTNTDGFKESRCEEHSKLKVL